MYAYHIQQHTLSKWTKLTTSKHFNKDYKVIHFLTENLERGEKNQYENRFKILSLVLRIKFTDRFYSTIKLALTLNYKANYSLQKKSYDCGNKIINNLYRQQKPFSYKAPDS